MPAELPESRTFILACVIVFGCIACAALGALAALAVVRPCQ